VLGGLLNCRCRKRPPHITPVTQRKTFRADDYGDLLLGEPKLASRFGAFRFFFFEVHATATVNEKSIARHSVGARF